MSCVYHVETDDFGTYDVLTDDAMGVRVGIRRLGAEMVSLARRSTNGAWEGFLYRDNETGPPVSGWKNHATVLGYFLHRLVNEKSDYEGDRIQSGIHGFLRAFSYEAPTFDPDARSLTFVVDPERIPRAAYPRAVALRLSYALTDEGVTVNFQFENRETLRPAHVSFGLHPGFAVSSLAGAALHVPAGEYLRLFAPGNFLDGHVETVAVEAGPMPFDRGKLEDSYLFSVERVLHRQFLLRDEPAGREVALDFAEVPYFTLWSSSDQFLCVEPCWGLPDSLPQKPFAKKDGIHTIAAGGTLSAKCSIGCRLL